jgi:hypothetical protein
MIPLKQRIGIGITDSTALFRFYAYLIVAVGGLIHLYIACANHFYFRTFAYDYGVYNFAWRDFAHLHSSSVPIYLSQHPPAFIQDHFSLTLPLLAPLYWLVQPLLGTYSLLVIQWAFIMLGAWYTLQFAEKRTHLAWLPPIVVLYSFLLLGRYTAYQNDFNIVILGASVWPIFFFGLLHEKKWLVSLSSMFILINREDGALGLFFIALFFYFSYPKHAFVRRYTPLLALISIIYFTLTFLYFIPALADEHNQFSLFTFSALGKDPFEAVTFLMHHPLTACQLLFVNHTGHPTEDYYKSSFYLVYLLSGGWILLTRPLLLFPLIPFLAKKMWNDDAYRWGLEGFYSVEIATLLPLLLVMAVAQWTNEIKIRWALTLTLLLTLLTTLEHTHNRDTSKYNFANPAFQQCAVNREKLMACLNQLPADAAVCASGKIIPHLALRDHIYYFPRYEQADYVLVFLEKDTYPLKHNEFAQNISDLRTSQAWQVLYEDKQLLLMKRKAFNGSNAP